MMTDSCADLELHSTTQLSGAAAGLGDQLASATPDDLGKPDKCARPELLCKARPVVEHLAPFAGETPADLAPLAKVMLSGAFSLMCTLRMDSLESWARVFDFSMTPDEDSITAGAIEATNHFHFTVFQGSLPVSVRVDDFFELGREATMLCTVSSFGHMKVFKDGALVGENPLGAAPKPIERPHMIVGGHFHFTNQAFCGSLSNVKVWDQEVSWATACADSTEGCSGSDTASGPDSVTASDSEPEADELNSDDAGSSPVAV